MCNNRIKILRQQHNLTQEDLAAYLNMTPTQIGRRERGEIPLRSDEISQLLNLFHCSYEDLIGGDSNAH